jgi:hypothetical protein
VAFLEWAFAAIGRQMHRARPNPGWSCTIVRCALCLLRRCRDRLDSQFPAKLPLEADRSSL